MFKDILNHIVHTENEHNSEGKGGILEHVPQVHQHTLSLVFEEENSETGQ